ncbi:hypothetical protein M378DRAFT_108174 [Amanita muscaria Koide BX008]|uniref:Cytochrome P450 n=1 Tax=Amanita muscaria (strain Koide BX008) TaxID=946122 RepID=A0A0C2WM51_AMAMK|nr:hypothetical protein M378DRAFT_108174 [Amanita muscaria Koide BX008]
MREKFFENDFGLRLEKWANEYGSVYKLPIGLGRSHVILCDPKAITHFHAKDGFTYLRHPFLKAVLEMFLGHSMVTTDKDDHKRLRRMVVPAFTSTSLRSVLNVFYDCTHKAPLLLISRGDSAKTLIRLDCIGIAGFGHDFKALEGHKSAVTEAFEAFETLNDPESFHLFMLIGNLIPQIVNIPMKSGRLFKKLKTTLSEIAENLLQESRSENHVQENKSILGLLLKGQSDTNINFSRSDRILCAIFSIILTLGFLVTLSVSSNDSVSLYDHLSMEQWALVELSRNQAVQNRLRKELNQSSTGDPTWDQLMSGLPYLDAVVHETLRFYPPLDEIAREAGEDDIIPLSRPLELASGETVNAISVPKGTIVVSPITFTNLCEEFWGPDSRKFIPERWLDGNPCRCQDLLGHRHLYTFSDGPRMCLGRVFALTEIKAVLSVLIRNFTFELLNGPETKIGVHRSSIMPRPKLAGEIGTHLPMRVRPVVR